MTKEISKDEKKEIIENIEEEISELNINIRKLNEELEDIHNLKSEADQTYDEILEYWKGEPAFKMLSEADDERREQFRILIQNREDELQEAESKKKRLIDKKEDIR
ncbi:MAG: hypothetical protein IKE52_05205 [Mogibacterium sp.]|nr:hypothetical protein [Mogibacterium sp.]